MNVTTSFILQLFAYGRQDGKTKVPHNLFDEKTKVFRLSATHCWTLIRIIPIIFGAKFQRDIHYIYFCSAIEIFRSLCDDSYDENKLKLMEDRIENYLSRFKYFYPDVKISAKMHFMVHYPRCIRENGNPLDYTTMRFDLNFTI